MPTNATAPPARERPPKRMTARVVTTAILPLQREGRSDDVASVRQVATGAGHRPAHRRVRETHHRPGDHDQAPTGARGREREGGTEHYPGAPLSLIGCDESFEILGHRLQAKPQGAGRDMRQSQRPDHLPRIAPTLL